ncbi:MAG: hypothetical protein LUD50_00735 [Clostridia bacterium]|nr:hypothetical protein [Clostridia bacterium]
MKNTNNNKTAVKVTAIILAIVILAVAIFCTVWFTTCSKSDSNINNTLDAGTSDGQDDSSTGNTGSTGGSSTDNTGSTGGSSTDSTGSTGDSSTGSSSSNEDSSSTDSNGGSNADGSSTENSDGSTGGSAGSSGGNGSGTLVRDITDTDLQDLTSALKTVRTYNSSYYATTTEDFTDNINGETSESVSKYDYDMDNTSFLIVIESNSIEADSVESLYMFEDLDAKVLTICDSYTDNMDSSKSYDVAYIDSYHVYDLVYTTYTCNYVGNLFSIQTNDDFLADESSLTEADVIEFMQRYLYFAGEEYSDNLETVSSRSDGALYGGNDYVEVFDIDNGLMFRYDYTKEFSYEGYAIQYVSTTAVILQNGYVTERVTQEELIITDISTTTAVYDTSYSNIVTISYECNAELFDVDFTSYDGYEDIIAQQAADPDDGAEESEETDGD